MTDRAGNLTALPVIVSTESPKGLTCLPVVGYTQTTLPADLPVAGNLAAQPVYLVSAAQIASGEYVLSGNLAALPVVANVPDLAANGDVAPIAVYVVGGSLGAPTYLLGEVGDVADDTVVIVFTGDITSPSGDYDLGVTIRVNGVAATISSATLQPDGATIYYVLSAAVVADDLVTWAYDSGVGDLEGAVTGDPVATIAAQTVANNVHGALTGQSIGLLLALTYA